MKDYYGILGVNRDSSSDEIKKAYRKLSKQYHPDVNPDGEDKFKEIAEAYDILSNPDKKQKYDNPSMFGGGNMGFEDFLSQMGFNTNPFGGGRKKAAPEKIIKLDITPFDSYKSANKEITYRREMACNTCNGSGGDRVTCTVCQGAGVRMRQFGQPPFQQILQETCGHCKGKGFTLTRGCIDCGSLGTKGEYKTMTITLQHGLDDGEYYRIEQGGDYHNGVYGNLLIKIHMTANDNWEKIGDDFFYTNYMSYSDLLKESCEIPHPDGTLSVRYPELFDSSKPMRVRGKGFRRERIGDLYIKNIVKFKKDEIKVD